METYGSHPSQDHIPIISINTLYKTVDIIIFAFDQCGVVSNGDTLKVIIFSAHIVFTLWDSSSLLCHLEESNRQAVITLIIRFQLKKKKIS